MDGLGSWQSLPLLTIGETLNGYTPVGILDGIGAISKDSVVRVFVNHELGANAGHTYQLGNGLVLKGARVSYFDIDTASRQIVDGDVAFSVVIDRAGSVVASATQINEGVSGSTSTTGIDRLCSSSLFKAGTYNLEDDIYFTGEETSSGQEFALDVNSDTLWCLPWLGRAAWENVTLLETGESDHVAILIGDDRTGAPLLLYVGEKNHFGDGSFLDRNGLKWGNLHVWVADNGNLTPATFFGTGALRTGKFKKILYYVPALAGTANYDAQGFATQTYQDALGDAIGAFSFSRPEDLATNPANPNQVVLASTGSPSLSDAWGTTYLIDVNLSDLNNILCNIRIIYDGDDSGNGQFSAPDFGLRSPDNLDWAGNGLVYIQEDRSVAGFGAQSGQEASIWELNPATGNLTRIAKIDRTAVPSGQVDSQPNDLGNWESSGILDVSALFGVSPDSLLFVADVQAHSLTGGPITADTLVEGGQLFLFKGYAPCELVLADTFFACAGETLTISRPVGLSGFQEGGNVAESVNFTQTGTYPLVAVAPNGCQATDTVVAIFTNIVATATKTNNTGSACSPNGAINLTRTGGTAPFEFLWSNGATTEDINNLAGGTYQVTITDDRGCTKSLPAPVTISGTKPLSMTSVTYKQPLCNGSSTGARITVNITGGKRPYTYQWSNGTTTTTPTNYIQDIPAGTYTVTLTDANGCIFVSSNLVLNEPTALVINNILVEPDMPPGRFKATFTVSGGVQPYRYSRSAPTGFGVNNPIRNLLPGTYNMGVRDKNGCITTQTVTIPSNLQQVGNDRNAEESSLEFSLSPNPVSSVLTVNLTGSNGNFSVYDELGRLMIEQSVDGENMIQLNVEELPKGVYFAVFTSNLVNKSSKKSFVVVK